MSEVSPNVILELAAQVVSAHVSNNMVAPEALPDLIKKVHRALTGAGGANSASAQPQPAVPVKRSVTPDYIVCLEDGKRFKTLKRHLASTYQMTPAQYRERWGLPNSYPMVATNYAKRRSAIAREIGLGSKDASLAAPTKQRRRPFTEVG